MSDLTIISNNHVRPVLYGYELTAAERAEFDYVLPDDFDSYTFVRYKGEVYDLNEFMRAPDEFGDWHGYKSDTYFSGILIRYLSRDAEYCVMGRYYS